MDLRSEVQRIALEHHGRYGYRRMRAELRRQGMPVNHNRVARLPLWAPNRWTDLQMLLCVGGRERTESEYRALLTSAGFNLQKAVATASPLSLLVAKSV